MIYWLTRNLAHIVLLLYFRVRVVGGERVPKTGRLIIAANHSSFIDPILVGAFINRKVHYMAKDELFAKPILKWLLPRIGVFPVARGTGDRGAIRKAIELLEDDKVLGIFPEGTRSADGDLGSPQPGTAMIAARTGAPIMLVACVGTYAAFPKGRKFPKPLQVQLRIGPTLTTQELGLDTGKADRKESRQRIESAGRKIMDGIRGLLEGEDIG